MGERFRETEMGFELLPPGEDWGSEERLEKLAETVSLYEEMVKVFSPVKVGTIHDSQLVDLVVVKKYIEAGVKTIVLPVVGWRPEMPIDLNDWEQVHYYDKMILGAISPSGALFYIRPGNGHGVVMEIVSQPLRRTKKREYLVSGVAVSEREKGLKLCVADDGCNEGMRDKFGDIEMTGSRIILGTYTPRAELKRWREILIRQLIGNATLRTMRSRYVEEKDPGKPEA